MNPLRSCSVILACFGHWRSNWLQSSWTALLWQNQRFCKDVTRDINILWISEAALIKQTVSHLQLLTLPQGVKRKIFWQIFFFFQAKWYSPFIHAPRKTLRVASFSCDSLKSFHVKTRIGYTCPYTTDTSVVPQSRRFKSTVFHNWRSTAFYWAQDNFEHLL